MDYKIAFYKASNQYEIREGDTVLAAMTDYGTNFTTLRVEGRTWEFWIESYHVYFNRYCLRDDRGAVTEAKNEARVGVDFTLPINGDRYRFVSNMLGRTIEVWGENGGFVTEVRSKGWWTHGSATASFFRPTADKLVAVLIGFDLSERARTAAP